MNALDHWAPTYECDGCDEEFNDPDERNIHMDECGHERWECETCDRKFASPGAQEQHMNAVGHWEHYCQSCRRNFDNANNLRMVSHFYQLEKSNPTSVFNVLTSLKHMNSKTHRGSDVPCPFCRKGFTTASGVSNHLETGSCPNASVVNRESIYKLIKQRDSQGLFTNKLLEWKDDREETWSTSNAYNGHDYECYLCHRCFRAPAHLDQHLKSPAHMQQIYHCPNSKNCGLQFKTLAAMFNHLESESCRFTKFEAVQRNMTNFFNGGQVR
ncbi:uncharacterized protein KY384_006706 [Bacidia gigantensis]|uniref:uncharacterized protein n=1 Tax=Bacidia gigantensis TaxID=2732470 RepID=UPI001D05419E|nr:uncharacterized protein KY384_006706 [Bacidia gigantensis]KAG8529016.1 hypothetical protein KY384_006706 [Bacidia gigantensis]